MQKKFKMAVAASAVLVIIILSANLAMGAVSVNNTLTPSPEASDNIDASDDLGVLLERAETTEQLKELTPVTLDEAEQSIYPLRRRFLMWTSDGIHIMWGSYGNGRFVGTDNLGKRCWGIYGKGIFAGFYAGEFFWGKYDGGKWKAEYLFGLESSSGAYVLFPPPAIASDRAESP